MTEQFQFTHMQTFARVRSRPGRSRQPDKFGVYAVGESRRTAANIIAEAIRIPENSPHVPNPKPPVWHYGIEPENLMNWVINLEKKAEGEMMPPDRRGCRKKQREDTPILLGIVASYPKAADDNDPVYLEWKRLSIEFYKKEFPDQIASILEHTDEPHGHLHIYVHNDGQSVKPLHPGHAAAKKVELELNAKALADETPLRANMKEAGKAYKAAMVALQDRFWSDVGFHVGQARIGPRVQRLTRRQWHAQKKAQQALIEKAQEVDALARKVAQRQRAKDAEIIENVKRLEVYKKKFDKERALISGQQMELIEEKSKAAVELVIAKKKNAAMKDAAEKLIEEASEREMKLMLQLRAFEVAVSELDARDLALNARDLVEEHLKKITERNAAKLGRG